MKKIKSLFAAIAAVSMMMISCVSTGGDGQDPAITKGVNAWNNREPAAATAYWTDIKDAETQKKYLGYVTAYEAGVAALDSTDSIKSTNESKLLSATRKALNNFATLDPALKLPEDVKEKGAVLTAARINKLVESNSLADAKSMQKTAIAVYGEHPNLKASGKEVNVASSIASKQSTISTKLDEASAVSDLDGRIEAYNKLVKDYEALAAEVDKEVKNSGVSSTSGVTAAAKRFKNLGQDVSIKRQAAIREKAYIYKERINEAFARQPSKAGSGKNGAYTSYDIRDHYNSVQNDIDVIYNELLKFRTQYPSEIGQDVINDINAQRTDLKNKIAQVNREIANQEEIASRGRTVMPLMIGLFNPEQGTSGANKRSRPAKFSASSQKSEDYWWGMVDIPRGQMNDLVITCNGGRTIRVFNQNTKSGKNIKKNNLQDLVSQANRVGNSWPVMNAGSKLNGSNYYFEVGSGNGSYSGTVVVYSSFVVRKR